MAYFLAVDAGGTKTEFLLATEDRELARARTGTIKRVNADAATAEKNLDEALAELQRSTGVSMTQVERTCVGTSGDTVPLVTEWLQQSFQRACPVRCCSSATWPSRSMRPLQGAVACWRWLAQGRMRPLATAMERSSRQADGAPCCGSGRWPLDRHGGPASWLSRP